MLVFRKTSTKLQQIFFFGSNINYKYISYNLRTDRGSDAGAESLRQEMRT